MQYVLDVLIVIGIVSGLFALSLSVKWLCRRCIKRKNLCEIRQEDD